MSKFVIQGPCSLHGEITVSGSKNAALPIIAATLLAVGKYTLTNVPMISDIRYMLGILEDLGAKTSLVDNVCTIDTTGVNRCNPDPKKIRHIRASILVIGPLLARCGSVKMAQPGGCLIGARPINTTLDGFVSLGATIKEDDNFYVLSAEKLKGTQIILNEPSVTGTENLVMAATLAEGVTEIRLAAAEPHVVDLCNFLVQMGAKIDGIGTTNLVITGVTTG